MSKTTRQILIFLAGGLLASGFYTVSQPGWFTHLVVAALLFGLLCLSHMSATRRIAGVRNDGVENFCRMKKMAELQMTALESLVNAIAARDRTTPGHVHRTRIYATELGKLAGVSESELEALHMGALLHDVGKISVPESILNKPGKLTPGEFEKMKTHTVLGGDIVKRVNFPYPVEEVVRFHHEKWDGSGYPDGLQGKEIPRVAQIFSLVDFYDITRCDRPHRAGLKREECIELLWEMSNSSFEPQLVEMFADNVDYFDSLIPEQDIREQTTTETIKVIEASQPCEVGSALPDAVESDRGFRSIAAAQREAFALHEISQLIGISFNLQDTLALVSNLLAGVVPFDTCVIFFSDDNLGIARPAHVSGEHVEHYRNCTAQLGKGITGKAIARARSMCGTSMEDELCNVPVEIAGEIRGVLSSPLSNDDGAFGTITLYSATINVYTSTHLRLLESIALHASNALANALLYEKSKERALADPITELPNSRAFNLMLDQRVAECQRKNREPFALLNMDLDDFKNINERYGHGIGDCLLASISEVIKAQLRQMDALGRFDGDRFAAIMPSASAESATVVAERIRMAVESHEFIMSEGRVARVGISIGVAAFPTDGEIADDLLTAAERHMLRDKHLRKLSPHIGYPSPVVPINAYR